MFESSTCPSSTIPRNAATADQTGVYSLIEQTPGANAFDDVLGRDAPRIKRGKHSFAAARNLRGCCPTLASMLLTSRLEQTIVFPLCAQLHALSAARDPDDFLLKDRTDSERKEIISSVVSNATSAVGPLRHCEVGRFWSNSGLLPKLDR